MAENSEVLNLQQAIETLENQRNLLGDQVVDTSIAALQERLKLLQINRKKFLAHNSPDAGGTDEFFIFAKTLDDLMGVIGQLIKLADFNNTLRLHKSDWWTSVGNKL